MKAVVQRYRQFNGVRGKVCVKSIAPRMSIPIRTAFLRAIAAVALVDRMPAHAGVMRPASISGIVALILVAFVRRMEWQPVIPPFVVGRCPKRVLFMIAARVPVPTHRGFFLSFVAILSVTERIAVMMDAGEVVGRAHSTKPVRYLACVKVDAAPIVLANSVVPMAAVVVAERAARAPFVM